MTVSSPIWKIWTFPVTKGNEVCATIAKKWSGIVVESFLDADRFKIDFTESSLSAEERFLLLSAGIYIDLNYFEKKARN